MTMTFEQAINHPSYAYSTARSWRADGYVKTLADLQVRAYFNDSTSPSGVVCAAGSDDYVAACEALKAAGKSEPRRR